MKGLVLRAPEKIAIEEVACPKPGADEVLVKVQACGICGSDIPRAYRDGAHNMPLIIGHEFAGVVEAVGSEASEAWVGKRVGVFPLIPCMKCVCCKIRKYEMCSSYSYLGSRRDGGFAEYVTVPEWNLIELPDKVDFDAAAMLEPMAVAVHAIRQAFRTKGYDVDDVSALADKKFVVVGLGTIGLLVVMFLKDLGFKNVYTIGNKELQKKMVTSLGVDEDDYCDINVWDEIDWIRGNTGVKGADFLFECVGNSRSLDACIYGATPEGVVCTVGNPSGDMDLHRHAYWQILRNQLTLVGTWNSSFTHEADDDWHYVLKRLQQGGIHPEKLITHRFTLEDIVEGFEIMRDKKEAYVKVMAEM
ncbi:L-iditol 2-dehydrogenase [Pseudobutyrivibrio sp. YE44]|uniref:galactitol-1-phosphate 5-dehydrogenase n=1 Tax=Pseudobutyrivibrio sp. YE44 TaxID=1520802 RepID=UPI00088F0A17|nr:galactitol-1-phosphate 5-dehydrogenase [Pseudobutyrivibrio sp. YE44]SDB28688.1 L-iditol 2-dehydrogenase [Pseudobutyrivibrio sp. YE44]